MLLYVSVYLLCISFIRLDTFYCAFLSIWFKLLQVSFICIFLIVWYLLYLLLEKLSVSVQNIRGLSYYFYWQSVSWLSSNSPRGDSPVNKSRMALFSWQSGHRARWEWPLVNRSRMSPFSRQWIHRVMGKCPLVNQSQMVPNSCMEKC